MLKLRALTQIKLNSRVFLQEPLHNIYIFISLSIYMQKKSEAIILMLFVVLALASLSYNYNRGGLQAITGAQQIIPVPSSATIMSYFAIAAGGALATPGIVWSNIATLPAVDIPADADYSGVGSTTNYFISVSSDSNINVDMCTSASGPLTSGLNTIPIVGYSWGWSILNDALNPSPPGASMSTVYTSAGTNFAPGNNDYFRFWLDVPSGQPAGTYTNTINFKGVQTGQPC